MIGFIDPNGNYFECETDALGVFDEDGARIGGPLIVPRRPDPDSEYDAATGKWKARVLTLDETKARQKAAIEADAASKRESVDDALLRVLVAVAKGAQPAPDDVTKLGKDAAVIAARDKAVADVDAAKSKTAVGNVVIAWP